MNCRFITGAIKLKEKKEKTYCRALQTVGIGYGISRAYYGILKALVLALLFYPLKTYTSASICCIHIFVNTL